MAKASKNEGGTGSTKGKGGAKAASAGKPSV